MSDIAACHGVDVSSVTPRLKRLEQSGLVLRGAVSTDARASLITISDEGIQALESVHSARRELLVQAVGDSDAAHLSVTAGLLSHITEHLSSNPASAIRPGEAHHA